MSSNFESSCSSNVSTKAVSSWGLEISEGLGTGNWEVGVLDPMGSGVVPDLAGVEAGVTLSGRAEEDINQRVCVMCTAEPQPTQPTLHKQPRSKETWQHNMGTALVPSSFVVRCRRGEI